VQLTLSGKLPTVAGQWKLAFGGSFWFLKNYPAVVQAWVQSANTKK
jgi:hypothetical protein